jgi:hypothetical protein
MRYTEGVRLNFGFLKSHRQVWPSKLDKSAILIPGTYLLSRAAIHELLREGTTKSTLHRPESFQGLAFINPLHLRSSFSSLSMAVRIVDLTFLDWRWSLLFCLLCFSYRAVAMMPYSDSSHHPLMSLRRALRNHVWHATYYQPTDARD